MARPTKYDPEYHPKHAYNYCLMGATNEELATFFEVAVSTIDLWIAKHEEFSGALKRGRAQADALMAERTFTRGIGFEVETEKVGVDRFGSFYRIPTKTYYPPDVTAAIFWLKNRQPEKWRDRKEMTHDPGPATQAALEQGKPWAAVYINGRPMDGDDGAGAA